MMQERIVQQVDKMVKSGRITKDEAAQLCATQGTADFDAALGAIRARHAAGRMEQAIATGDMTQDEADGYLEQLRSGEHPRGLRARLRMHRPGRHSTQ